MHLDVLSDFCKSEPGTNNHNLLSMELSNICLHNVMFRFLDSQLSALSRSSGNLEDLEIRISAAQRHMYDGYQVYWMCGLTSIEFNSYQEMAEIWNTLKLIFQLRNIWVYIIVLFINNIFACLKSVFQTKSYFNPLLSAIVSMCWNPPPTADMRTSLSYRQLAVNIHTRNFWHNTQCCIVYSVYGTVSDDITYVCVP